MITVGEYIRQICVNTFYGHLKYTCCSQRGSVDDPDQNNFQKNFTKDILGHLTLDSNMFHSIAQ